MAEARKQYNSAAAELGKGAQQSEDEEGQARGELLKPEQRATRLIESSEPRSQWPRRQRRVKTHSADTNGGPRRQRLHAMPCHAQAAAQAQAQATCAELHDCRGGRSKGVCVLPEACGRRPWWPRSRKRWHRGRVQSLRSPATCTCHWRTQQLHPPEADAVDAHPCLQRRLPFAAVGAGDWLRARSLRGWPRLDVSADRCGLAEGKACGQKGLYVVKKSCCFCLVPACLFAIISQSRTASRGDALVGKTLG